MIRVSGTGGRDGPAFSKPQLGALALKGDHPCPYGGRDAKLWD